MRILRGFLGFLLFFLVVLAWDQKRHETGKEVMVPEYERSTLKGRDFVYYTIQPGDTLSGLERKFRIPSRNAIQELNPELNPQDLPVNKQIKIPLN